MRMRAKYKLRHFSNAIVGHLNRHPESANQAKQILCKFPFLMYMNWALPPKYFSPWQYLFHAS